VTSGPDDAAAPARDHPEGASSPPEERGHYLTERKVYEFTARLPADEVTPETIGKIVVRLHRVKEEASAARLADTSSVRCARLPNSPAFPIRPCPRRSNGAALTRLTPNVAGYVGSQPGIANYRLAGNHLAESQAVPAVR
jgi:hypothetical protein